MVEVERQCWGEITEGLGAPIVRVLLQRRGLPTVVRMASGEEFIIYDGSGWGRDFGDMWEHVTAHVTPLEAPMSDNDLRFFYLSEIVSLSDPVTGQVLLTQIPAPGET